MATVVVASYALNIWRNEIDYEFVNKKKSECYDAIFDLAELYYEALSGEVLSLSSIPAPFKNFENFDNASLDIINRYYRPIKFLQNIDDYIKFIKRPIHLMNKKEREDFLKYLDNILKYRSKLLDNSEISIIYSNSILKNITTDYTNQDFHIASNYILDPDWSKRKKIKSDFKELVNIIKNINPKKF